MITHLRSFGTLNTSQENLLMGLPSTSEKILAGFE